jgi:CBS domain-containing protein
MISRGSATVSPILGLDAGAAADLMTSNPVSLRETATVAEAIALLTDKGFTAAPVINAAGHPIGVLSRSDILTHEREKASHPLPDVVHTPAAGLASRTEAVASTEPVLEYDAIPQVRDLMTPVVFSVAPDTAADRVVEEMLALHVHRLFVVDRNGVLVGVITALDVLRHLRLL